MVDKSNEYGYVPSSPTQARGANTGIFEVNDVTDLLLAEQWSGDFGKLELIETQTYSGAVSYVDFTSISESTYNVHFMTFNNVDFVSEQGPKLQFYESGTLETAGVYQYVSQQCQSNGSFAETYQSTSTYFGIGNFAVGPSNGYCYLYNLGDSSKYSFITFHDVNSDVDASPSEAVADFGSGVLPQTSTVDGIRFTGGGTNLSSFVISLYGIAE